MLGMAHTAEDLPLCRELFVGHTAEYSIPKPVIGKMVQRFPVKRIMPVADRKLAVYRKAGRLAITELDWKRHSIILKRRTVELSSVSCAGPLFPSG